MAINKQNLKIPTSEQARINGAKGGKASAEARERRKLLRECLQELMSMEYDTKQGKKAGCDVVAAALVKKAMSGDVKAFEVVRDTLGEKPVERVVTAEIDPADIAAVEELVKRGF